MCNATNDLRMAWIHTYVCVLWEGSRAGERAAVDDHKLGKILFYEFGQRLVKVKVFFFFGLEGAQKKTE